MEKKKKEERINIRQEAEQSSPKNLTKGRANAFLI
jgi:hypothetical protein